MALLAFPTFEANAPNSVMVAEVWKPGRVGDAGNVMHRDSRGRPLPLVASLLAVMRQLNRQLAYGNETIKCLTGHDERGQRLRTVPGIGPVIAMPRSPPSTPSSASPTPTTSRRTSVLVRRELGASSAQARVSVATSSPKPGRPVRAGSWFKPPSPSSAAGGFPSWSATTGNRTSWPSPSRTGSGRPAQTPARQPESQGRPR